MNGSLKSLTRALNNIFDNWDDEVLYNENNPEVNNLHQVIELMKEKRSTLQIIKNSSSINDELFKLYYKSIKPSSNLKKEKFFLTVLNEIYSILKEEEVEAWIETYLKPAVDSAGYDIEFVHKARELITKIGINETEINDLSYMEMRERLSKKLLDKLILLFLGIKNDEYTLIGITLSEEDLKKQVTHERIRLIKMNCRNILCEYGIKKTKLYFAILNTYFLLPCNRLGILTLLSRLVSIPNIQLKEIVDTPLFPNILKASFYDYSENCILPLTYIIFMILPHIYLRISRYVSDIFLVYFRLTCWIGLKTLNGNRTDLSMPIFQENNDINDWDYLGPEATSSISGNKLDSQYLATLLYAFFPSNFIRFCYLPYLYLKEYPNDILKVNIFKSMDTQFSSGEVRTIKLDKILTEMSNKLIKTFLLHPNFMRLDSNSLEVELSNPLGWIEDSNIFLDPRKIILECLGLNPSLIISIPDSITEDDVILGENTRRESMANMHRAQKKLSKSDNFEDEMNSLNEKFGQLTKLSNYKPYYDIGRKLSLVPTNLIIDNTDEPNILFKDVNFNENKKTAPKESKLNTDSRKNESDQQNLKDSFNASKPSNPTSPLLSAGEGPNIDPLADLFATHEKLYAPKSEPHSDNAIESSGKTAYYFNNERTKGELLMQNPMSSPTISLETAPVHKGSTNGMLTLGGSSTGSKEMMNGTAIDFYQRELLLLKNELEFTSYMKHLNKYNYLLLRLKMNKMLRDNNVYNSTYNIDSLKLKNLQADYADLVKSLEDLRLEYESYMTRKEMDINKLKNLLTSLQDEVLNLRQGLKAAQENTKLIDTKLNDIKHNNENYIEDDSGSIESSEIRNDIQNEFLPTKNLKNEPILNEYEQKIAERDEQIFSISEELCLLKEENLKLMKMSETNSSGLSMSGGENGSNNFRMEINESIHTLTMQYERKIKELNAMIIKYENLLEEKNSRILYLTTTKPISIPGSGKAINLTYSASDEDNERSTNSTSPPLPTFNRTPIHTPTHTPAHTPTQNTTRPALGPSSKSNSMNSIPTIKGRGGYQKRTKIRK